MKVSCIVVLIISTYTSESVYANYRVCMLSILAGRLTTSPRLQFKRQLGGYRFPGPRLSDDYASASRALVKREPQYEDEYSRGTSPSPYRSPQSSAYQPEVSEYPSRSYAPSASYQRDNKRSVSPLCLHAVSDQHVSKRCKCRTMRPRKRVRRRKKTSLKRTGSRPSWSCFWLNQSSPAVKRRMVITRTRDSDARFSITACRESNTPGCVPIVSCFPMAH